MSISSKRSGLALTLCVVCMSIVSCAQEDIPNEDSDITSMEKAGNCEGILSIIQ